MCTLDRRPWARAWTRSLHNVCYFHEKIDPMFFFDWVTCYRESQGRLDARTHLGIQNDVLVYTFVAFSGHQEGVRLCPEVDFLVVK